MSIKHGYFMKYLVNLWIVISRCYWPIGAKLYKIILLIAFAFYLFALPAFAGWAPEVRISEPVLTFYPDMVSEGNTVHVVYVNSNNGVGYVRSTDEGVTWSQPIELSDSAHSSGVFTPKLVVSGSNVMVLWIDRSHILNRRNIGYVLSNNAGGSWNQSQYILEQNLESISDIAVAGSNSAIAVVFNTQSGHSLDFYGLKSTDFGSTWNQATYIFESNQSGKTDMAGYGGHLHFVWLGNFEDGEIWETYYINSHDGGDTWSDNVPLADLDSIGSYWPAITTGGSGELAVAWTDFKYSPNWWTADIFVRFSFDNGQYWTDEQQISYTHLDAYPDIFWSGDTVQVVWERGNLSERSVYYLCSTDDGISWGDEYRLDSDTSASYTPVVSAFGTRRYAIWADQRNHPQDSIFRGVYFTYYDDLTEVNESYVIPDKRYNSIVYPNPFNHSVIIGMTDISGSDITVEIYDILGNMIRKLNRGGGSNGLDGLIWYGKNTSGNDVGTGIYFAKIISPNITTTAKLLYLK